MGVYLNSTVVTLNSALYTLAGNTPGSVPTDYGKVRTATTATTKASTGYTKPTKTTTPYSEAV